MIRLSLAVLLVCFLSSGAFAVTYEAVSGVVGNWSDPATWKDVEGGPEGDIPTGFNEVKIRYEGTIVTLDTSTGDWGVPGTHRLRVYRGATLNIVDGGELLGAGWMRVDTKESGGPSYVYQTGGLVQLRDNDDKDACKLVIGDEAGSNGFYNISGGTLTYIDTEVKDGGDLLVGGRGGTGTFTVVGADATIKMKDLYVGDRAGASGTLEFQIGATGVSPIGLDGTAYLDPEGDDATAALLLSLIDAPPIGADILLIDGAIEGTFDTVNAAPAPEGAEVVMSYGGTDYIYALTYAGSVELQWVIPEPATLVLLGLGGLIAVVRRPRKK